MIFEDKHVSELIEMRSEARLNKNWVLSDKIRNYLDIKLVFVFDTKAGQDVYYLTEGYFKFLDKKLETMAMSKRQYVEYKIKRDINAENNFQSWLFRHKNPDNL